MERVTDKSPSSAPARTGRTAWGTSMDDCTLPPECRLDLQITLDRLRSAEERCREGLRDLSAGTLSREDYLQVLRKQQDAQLDWLRKHELYFQHQAD